MRRVLITSFKCLTWNTKRYGFAIKAMRLAIGQFETTDWERWLHVITLSGAKYAVFGDEMLLFADDKQWENVKQVTEKSGLALKEYPHSIKESNLHLVVQVGNDFLDAHEDIPVVLNKGRYLAVDIDRNQARLISATRQCCFIISPLKRSRVVFAHLPPVPPSAPIRWIIDLTNGISRDNLLKDIECLVLFGTRLSTSSNYTEAATWAMNRLRNLGYSDAKMVPVDVNGGKSFNVTASKPGKLSGGPLVIVTAHLDSINKPGGPAADAPGADDNGSGCAGLLEIARVLSGHDNVHELRFALFGGEEQELFGSKEYVEQLSDDDCARLCQGAVINMDMIATVNTERPFVLLETAPRWSPVVQRLEEAASTYGRIEVQLDFSPHAISDHYPFIKEELPAVLTIEGASRANQNIHKIDDNMSHIDPDLMIRILQMNTAFVAESLGKGVKGLLSYFFFGRRPSRVRPAKKSDPRFVGY
jgi:Peptidase family M28